MRNPNGYGSVYKLSGKRRKPWRAVKTTGYDILTGKQMRLTVGYYPTRKEALEALANYVINPYNLDSKKLTFKEVFEKWSELHFKNISQSTIIGYNTSFRSLNALHERIFSTLRAIQLQEVMNSLTIAESSKRVVKSLLNSLYDYALRYEIVDKNYSALITLGKKETIVQRKPYTDEEISKLWKYKELPNVDTVLIMIYSGFRIGELLTLRNLDIDLENRTIKGGIKTNAGKNRIVPINLKILPLIKARMSPKNEYLIVDEQNKRILYEKYLYIYRKLMKQLGLKHTIHDCRHTFATLLSNADANKVSIAKIIGHNNYDITEKIYTHKDIEELKKAIDSI